MKYLSSLFAVILISGCASVEKGEKFKSVLITKEPILYIYRVKRVQLGGGAPQIRLNTAPVGKVDNGGFIAIKLFEGKNIISADKDIFDWNANCAPLEINAEAGKTYFSQVVIEKSGVNFMAIGSGAVANIQWDCAITLIPQQAAIQALKGLTANTKNAHGLVN